MPRSVPRPFHPIELAHPWNVSDRRRTPVGAENCVTASDRRLRGWLTSAPVGFQNSATAADQRFSSRGLVLIDQPPTIGRTSDSAVDRLGDGRFRTSRAQLQCSMRPSRVVVRSVGREHPADSGPTKLQEARRSSLGADVGVDRSDDALGDPPHLDQARLVPIFDTPHDGLPVRPPPGCSCREPRTPETFGPNSS